MGCFLTDRPTNQYDVTGISAVAPDVYSNGGRRLMVSDNPEAINNKSLTARSVLWHDRTYTGTTAILHRVFGWHASQTGRTSSDNGTPISFLVALTIENAGSSAISVSNIKRRLIIGSAGNPGAIGKCVAETQLANTNWDSFSPKESLSSIPAGTRRVIDYQLVSVNNMAGFVYELEVSSTNPDQPYYLRTVASPFTSDGLTELRGISGTPIGPFDTHPRGSWSYSELQVARIDVNVGVNNLVTVAGGGSQQIGFPQNTSYDYTRAIANRGHFGAKVYVPILFHNGMSSPKTVSVYSYARGGAPYFGAVNRPEGNAAIPLLPVDYRTYAHITDYTLSPGDTNAQLILVHAGGSDPASALFFKTAGL